MAEAPNLEELLVLNMRHLPVEQRFACFRGHPALRAALRIALGSVRRNVEVATLLGSSP